MTEQARGAGRWLGIGWRALLGLGVLLGLAWARRENFLLFHGLAEVFSIAVACGIFMLAWNSRRFVPNGYVLWIGIGYLFVASLDLVHTLAYPGMGAFPGGGTNPAAQLWIAARAMQAFSLLTAVVFLRRKLDVRLAVGGYAVATALALLSIFHWQVFPTCYSDSRHGLTLFKVVGEYVICAALLASAGLLMRYRAHFDGKVLSLLIGSILATVVSELAFTLYKDPYGLPNVLGHYLKIVAMYLIYKALVETGFGRPFDLLFRNLKQSEQAQRRLIGQLEEARGALEERVQERTVELRQTVGELESEVIDRIRAEQALRESEQRYRSLVELLPVGVNVISEGEFEYVNPAGARILGVAEAAGLVGRELAEFIPVHARPAVHARHQQALRGAVLPLAESQILRPDGQIAHVEETEAAISYSGRPAVLSVLRDITDRKESQRKDGLTRALLAMFARKTSRKEYLDSVVRLIRDWGGWRCVGIRVVDNRGNIPYESCVGFSREFLELENSLSLREHQCVCIRVVMGSAEPQESAVLTPGGSFRCQNTSEFVGALTEEQRSRYRGNCVRAGFASVAVIPIRYRGQVLGAVHLADERKNRVPDRAIDFLESMAPLIGEAIYRFGVEEELRREYQALADSEERYRLLFDAAPIGMLLSEHDGRVVAVNRSMSELFGYSAAEMHGMTVADFHVSRGQLDQFLRDLEQTGRVRNGQAKLRRKDRSTFFALLNADRVRIDGRDVVFTTLRDMSEHRRLEAEVLAAGEMERRRIGHDLHDGLGQRLAGIAFLARVLRRNLADQGLPQADSVARIEQHVNESVSLTRSLAQGLSPVGMRADSLAAGLRELAARTEEMFGASCQVQCDDSAHVDDSTVATHLYRIAQEAVTNAVRHGRARNITIALSADEHHVTLTIQDDGVGLTEPASGEHGMGLRIMRYRAEALGAFFSVHAVPAGGTRVSCQLPRPETPRP